MRIVNGLLLGAIVLSLHPLSAQHLTHGPIVGGVTSSSAHFCGRVDTVANVNIQLSTSPDFNTIIAGTTKVASAANDFVTLIRINGLRADTQYYYRVTVNEVPAGEIRQFRTFPPEGARQPFVFTFGSCQQSEPWQGSRSAGRVFDVMVRDLPRFFLQIGDWGYPDTTDTESDPTDQFSVEMSRVQESYRAKYAPDYRMQQVLRIAPVDYVYDDHDFAENNCSASTYSDLVQRREIPFPPEARLNSIAGYRQLFPGYPLANPNGGIWHKFTCGNADFFMLDTRAQRSPNMEALQLDPATGTYELVRPPGHSILAGDSSLVGENQRDWLLRELLASRADWKFIISSVPFNRGLRQAIDHLLALQGTTICVPGLYCVSGLTGALGLVDSWTGFPEDQEILLDFIRDRGIQNVIVLSGDFHTAAIDDGTNAGLPEMMAGALDRTNSRLVALMEAFGIRIWNQGGQTLGGLNFRDAYGRVTVNGAESVLLELVDEFGRILASYRVPAMRTGVSNRPADPVAEFRLSSGFPNPLRIAASGAQATVHYSLPIRARVAATIYDLLGRAVRHLYDQYQPAGEHTLRWNGKDDRGQSLASGSYLLSIELTFPNGRQQFASRKILVVK